MTDAEALALAKRVWGDRGVALPRSHRYGKRWHGYRVGACSLPGEAPEMRAVGRGESWEAAFRDAGVDVPAAKE